MQFLAGRRFVVGAICLKDARGAPECQEFRMPGEEPLAEGPELLPIDHLRPVIKSPQGVQHPQTLVQFALDGRGVNPCIITKRRCD